MSDSTCEHEWAIYWSFQKTSWAQRLSIPSAGFGTFRNLFRTFSTRVRKDFSVCEKCGTVNYIHDSQGVLLCHPEKVDLEA